MSHPRSCTAANGDLRGEQVLQRNKPWVVSLTPFSDSLYSWISRETRIQTNDRESYENEQDTGDFNWTDGVSRHRDIDSTRTEVQLGRSWSQETHGRQSA
jgi:hypothetical protein